MKKTIALLPLALLGSCLHHLLPGLRGPAPVSGPEVVRVKLKPQDQAASAGPRPSPEAARVIAALCLEEALKDYDSAKIQWAPTCGWPRGMSTIPRRRTCAPTARSPAGSSSRT